MGHRTAWFGFGAAVLIAAGACGGESRGDGSSRGGSAGSAGSGGAAGSSGSSGGAAGCGGGGAMDCVDPCDGHMYLPSCVNGAWTCAGGDVCDAGTCVPGTVPTVEGCLSCADASTKLAGAIESARSANAACIEAADCTLTGAGTACWGDCPAAVSKSGEPAFQSALSKLDADYCSAFVPECGYSTPKCAVPTLVCASGKCEATY
jgi:hypothetical protein